MQQEKNSRREFLRNSAILGATLTIPFHLPAADAKTLQRIAGVNPDMTEMNAFLKISPDDSVTVVIKHLEMGQGIHTGLPMILCEELGADWTKVKVETAPANNKLYANTLMGIQGTGGSSSISNSWNQLRQAGATAREMLISAAAEELKVPRTELKVENGKVIHTPSGNAKSFGSLAARASKMPQPENVQLKSIADFKIIGQPLARLDNDGKTSGQTEFAMDFRRPKQVVAVIARPPRFGGKVKTLDSHAAMKAPGVKAVLQIPQGVAVIADTFWQAKKGRDLLKISWNDDNAFQLSTDEMRKQYRDLLERKGTVAGQTGDVEKGKANGRKTITAEFEFPYLAHAPMEPLNCVIELKNGKCDIWSGSQMQTADQGAAAHILGLDPSKVSIHTLFAGGSFGRRATPTCDLVSEAASVAAAAKKNSTLANRPIHLMWTREDDIRGGYYRPFFMHKAEVGLDRHDKPAFWNHRIVGQSIMAGTPFAAMIKNGVDPTSVEGTSDMPYAIPNMYVDLHSPTQPVPVLWFRSVGHTHTAFVVETLIDELAEQAKEDPVDFRLSLLEKQPRFANVLKLAAEKAGWKKNLPKGHAHGIALHESFHSLVAVVAEVSLRDNEPHIERLVCAVDCGIVVNPDSVKAQMEGGMGFAVSAALLGAVHFEKGQVVESNFHDYRVLRMNQMPHVEVHIVKSSVEPTGVGEPGVPPVAPAIANALAKLTGKRIRQLPIKV